MVDKSKYLDNLLAAGGPVDPPYAGSAEASADSLIAHRAGQKGEEYFLNNIEPLYEDGFGGLAREKWKTFKYTKEEVASIDRLRDNPGTGAPYVSNQSPSGANAYYNTYPLLKNATVTPPADKPNTFTAKVGNKYYDPASEGYANAMKQQKLVDAGYTLPVDGQWGPKSQAAFEDAARRSKPTVVEDPFSNPPEPPPTTKNYLFVDSKSNVEYQAYADSTYIHNKGLADILAGENGYVGLLSDDEIAAGEIQRLGKRDADFLKSGRAHTDPSGSARTPDDPWIWTESFKSQRSEFKDGALKQGMYSGEEDAAGESIYTGSWGYKGIEPTQVVLGVEANPMPMYKKPEQRVFVKGTTPYDNAKKQEELQEAGLYTGKIDGIWGPKTDAAYVKMNQNASMPATKAKVAEVEKEEAAKVSTNTLTNFEVTTYTNQKFYYIASKDKGGKPIQVGEQAYKQLVKRKGWENNSMTTQDFMKMQ